MLFAIKNRLLPALLLLAAFVAVAFLARDPLGLTWRLSLSPGLPRQLLLAGLLIAVSDGALHGLLWLALRERYWGCCRELIAYFQPQGPLEVMAGGLLAGGEELFFRGVLLAGLVQQAGWGAGPALLVSALAFGALHLLPRPLLAPFALWAVWEGALFGFLYLWTGSLLVPVLAHTAHDLLGFSLFAWIRRISPVPQRGREPLG